MKNLKKLSALVLALVMVFSLSISASAIDGNEVYLSPATGTEYTTVTTASSVDLEVYFSAMDASYNWYNTGFDTADQAKTVTWTVIHEDNDLVNGNVTADSGSVNGLITAKGTVTLNSGKHGVAIVRATYGSFTLDLTICVEAAQTKPAATGVYCEISDARVSGVSAVAEGENLEVVAIAAEENHPLSNQTSTAMSYPTALGALYEMVGSSMTVSDGYVTSVTYGANVTLTAYSSEDWTEYYGWNYCVLREGTIVDEGNLMSASIFELQSGDEVFWAFGTADDAADYFAGL